MTATVAQLRTLVQDPSGAPILPDSDYEAIIALEDNVFRAAALAAQALAAKYAPKVDVKAGPVAVSNDQKFKHYTELARRFSQRAREGGGGSGMTPLMTGVSEAEIGAAREEADRVPEAFTHNMHDNPPGDDYTEAS